MNEEDLIQKFINTICFELPHKSKEEILQALYQFAELTQIILEKNRYLHQEKSEMQLDFENQQQQLKDEIEFLLQLQSQHQRNQDELLQKSDQTYEKIVNLEEEIRQLQVLNSIYKNQLDVKQNISDQTTFNQIQDQLKETLIENQYQQQQLVSLKTILSENKQDYQKQIQANSSIIQHQETVIKQLKEELSAQKQQVRLLRSENKQILDQISVQKSALKDISNSPYMSNSSKTLSKSVKRELQESRNFISSQKRYLASEELHDVNQFTLLEQELQDTNFNTTVNTQCRNSFNFQKTIIEKQTNNFDRNIYKDFFNLTSQCVKLNLDDEKILDTKVNHLYEIYVEQKIPYHKWYDQLKIYLLSKI